MAIQEQIFIDIELLIKAINISLTEKLHILFPYINLLFLIKYLIFNICLLNNSKLKRKIIYIYHIYFNFEYYEI